MRIRIQFGSRFGQVLDFAPTEARAMLADGRATLPAIDERPAPDPEQIMHRDPAPEHRDPQPGQSRTNPRPARRRG